MPFYEALTRLVQYGLDTGLLPASERNYAINRLLALYHEPDFVDPGFVPTGGDLEEILRSLLEEASARGLLTDNTTVWRDLFDTELMNCLTPRPQQVIDRFYADYAQSPQLATDHFYQFSQDTDYIRRYRIRRDVRWTVSSAYGEIELSINLSKPEKDPKAIAAAARSTAASYPACQLCMENEGYAGHGNHPARATHRIIPLKILDEDWGFQYSPYVYYNEHCIVLNQKHIPMRISRVTFDKLLDFVRQFPHYFLGSNADLPIVGGSILSHDHYQGGRHDFPMAKAPVARAFTVPGYDDVAFGVVRWPMSALRLRGKTPERLSAAAEHILERWRVYSDPAADILCETDGTPHHTVTPIARKRGDDFELDLVLRDNRTTDEHPLGLFHPHAEKHHIKKENIGLIEVMGLAILPARLLNELKALQAALAGGKDPAENPVLLKHAQWARSFDGAFAAWPEEKQWQYLLEKTGEVFVGVLEDAGVYKFTPEGQAALDRFLNTL